MVPFIGGTYLHRSKFVSPQKTLNMFLERIDNPKAKYPEILIGRPGSKYFKQDDTESTLGCRGLHYTSTGVLYAVYDQNLQRIDANGLKTNVLDIGSQNTEVKFADDGQFMLVVDRLKMWRIDLSDDSSTDITSSLPFDKPVDVKYINNRFVAINDDETIDVVANYNKFYWSDLADSNTWGALSWASAESNADPINAMAINQGQLWLFGINSYEVWRVGNNERLPFSRAGGSWTEIGCGAPNSVTTIGGNVFWLGSSRAGQDLVYMSNGVGTRTISDQAINWELSQIETGGAIGFTFQLNQHVFYVLTIPEGNKSFVYDVTTNSWSEWSTREANRDDDNYWEILYAVFAYGKIIVGTKRAHHVLELDLEQYQEYDGRPIVRWRQSPVYWQDLNRISYQEFAIDMEVGVGLNTGQGSDPQVMLSYSDDSGNTFGNQRFKPIGKIGEYMTFVRWTDLGSARNRVFRIEVSDPVKVIFLGARLRTQIHGEP